MDYGFDNNRLKSTKGWEAPTEHRPLEPAFTNHSHAFCGSHPSAIEGYLYDDKASSAALMNLSLDTAASFVRSRRNTARYAICQRQQINSAFCTSGI
jgi:hypothetical protein